MTSTMPVPFVSRRSIMRHDTGYFEEKQLGKSYDIKLLKRLYPFSRPHRWMILASIFLVIFITLLDLAIPYVTKIAIDQYIVPKTDLRPAQDTHVESTASRSRFLKVAPENPDIRALIDRHPEQFSQTGRFYIISYQQLSKLEPEEIEVLRASHLAGIGKIAAVFVLIIILSFGFNFLQKIVMEYTGHRMMNDLRLALFNHIQHLGMPFFTQNPVGRLVTRNTNDIQNMHELFTSVISLVFKDFFLLIGIAVVLLIMNWKLALVSFLVLPLVAYTSLAFSGRIREAFRVLRIKIAEINTKFGEMIDGIGVIQSFCKEKNTAEHFSRLNHENYLAGMRQINVLAVFMPLIEVFGITTVSVIIFYGGKNVLDGQISLGVLVAFISYMRMFFRPIRDLAEKYNILQNALASAERIFIIFDTQNSIDADRSETDPGQQIPARKTPQKIETFVLENVSFEYIHSEPVLTDISLSIRAGETVAIIGPTGSGKTSIANLIMRFYDPVSGRIRLNGKDIKSIPVSQYRANMALVTQEPFLFSDTIYANIWRDQHHVPQEDIARILSAANCKTMIERQPLGLRTILTRGGASLSSGERQLISIARAFARDPELILLDEATSYIDSLTEDAIQDALSKLMAGRTALVIAHRLSTVRQADTIIVLDKGHILEMGNHEVLMQKQGLYFRMNHLQHCIGNTC
jgi:ATP-binding cassette, subfamily B, multidrug efflux pump